MLQDGVQGLVKSVEEEERALAPGHVRAPWRERCSHIEKLLVKETWRRQRGKKKRKEILSSLSAHPMGDFFCAWQTRIAEGFYDF